MAAGSRLGTRLHPHHCNCKAAVPQCIQSKLSHSPTGYSTQTEHTSHIHTYVNTNMRTHLRAPVGQTLEDPVKGRLVQASVDLHVYRGRAERRAAGRARGHTRPPGTLLATQQAAMCVIHSLAYGRSHSTHHACSTKQTVVIIPDNTLNASYIKLQTHQTLESNHILDSVRLKLVEGGEGVVEAGKEVVPGCWSYHHANLSISWGGSEEGLTKVAGHRKLRLGYALWTHSLQHCWLPQSTSDSFSPLHLVLLPLISSIYVLFPLPLPPPSLPFHSACVSLPPSPSSHSYHSPLSPTV